MPTHHNILILHIRYTFLSAKIVFFYDTPKKMCLFYCGNLFFF